VFEVRPWKWFEPLVVRLMQRPDSFLYMALVPRQ
jgi:hypothetical protein